MNFLEVSYSRKESLDVPLPCSKYWKAAEDVPTVVQVFQRGELNVSQASMKRSWAGPAQCFSEETIRKPVKAVNIWQCVKTLYPCSSHQNSWDLWMFIPLKMVLIGIDPYPSVMPFMICYANFGTFLNLFGTGFQLWFRRQLDMLRHCWHRWVWWRHRWPRQHPWLPLPQGD